MTIYAANLFDAAGVADGDKITTANSGGDAGRAWDNVDSGAATYSDNAAHGTLGALLDQDGAARCQLQWINGADTAATCYARLYLWVDAAPGQNTRLLHYAAHGGAMAFALRLRTNGRFDLLDSVSAVMGTGTLAVPTGQWIRVETRVVPSATAGQATVRIYTDADGATPAETITSTAAYNTLAGFGMWRWGPTGNDTTFACRMDTVAVSFSDWLGAVVDPDDARHAPLPPTFGWRYHAMRLFPTRTWLNRELPLTDVSISPTLSGPQALTATLDPDIGSLEMSDGQPLLTDWNTFIVAEADGIIRGGGILVQSTFTGEEWQLEIAGFTHHAQGQAMTETLVYGGDNDAGRDAHGPTSGVGVSPITIVRDLWTQVASKPNSDLGITFGGDLTSKYKFSYWHNVPAIWNYKPDASTAITFSGAKTVNKVGYENVKVYGTGFTKSRKTAYVDATVAFDKANVKDAFDEPFKTSGDDLANAGIPFVPDVLADGGVKFPDKTGNIFWDHHTYFYENTDIGSKIDEYATEAPFDYVEHLEWSDEDKSDVIMRLDFGYPRLGGRKTNLRFVEGDNIFDLIAAVTGGDDYANAVVALGAGDGADQLRAEAFVDDGRLRVEKVLTATDIGDKTQLTSYAQAQLQILLGHTDVTEFTVKQHDNAPIGSFDVGDDLPLQLATGWLAGTKIWVRVTAMAIAPDSDEIQVTCKRSDSFSYSGG